MSEYVSPILNEIDSVNTLEIDIDEVAWYVVAAVILCALATTVIACCVLFCIAKGKAFTGSYSYVNNRHDIRLGCQ